MLELSLILGHPSAGDYTLTGCIPKLHNKLGQKNNLSVQIKNDIFNAFLEVSQHLVWFLFKFY